MGFQLSPGVNVSEIDLTTIVPAVSTTEGAIGGVFKWGPVEDRDLISSEVELVQRYGKPTSDNFETWFTAANFLAYANKLWVSRAASSNAFNSQAIANSGTSTSSLQIKNRTHYDTLTFSNTNILYFAKYPGVYGDSLRISVCDSTNAYSKTISFTNTSFAFTIGSNVGQLVVAGNTTAAVTGNLAVNDFVLIGNSAIGKQYMQISSIASDSTNATHAWANVSFYGRYFLSADYTETEEMTRYWEYYNVVDTAPGTTSYTAARGGTGDEMHVVVIDEDGVFTGVPKQVIEVFEGISRASDARGEEGGSIYYKDVLRQESRYVWWVNDRSGAPTTTSAAASAATTDRAYTASFSGGADGLSETAISLGSMINAYDQFRPADEVDVSLIMNGKAVSGHGSRGMGLAKYIIENICEYRKDCIALISPQQADVVNNPFQEQEDTILTRNEIGSSSYAVLDSGYKWQYDRYNDLHRWVPLNGDTAGLIVRTDDLRDPWWSPAGFNRGHIKNVTKLAFSPDKADRDLLYKNGVNPVVNFKKEGTVLFGDKTLLAKPSAFDRINVRRLFIVLEKAIATAAKYTLFEFNDAFTRAQFRNLVEPYLRDVQGRRGIQDFLVVCDETNNTGEVIDRNEFIGDIYIKPARSINFIQLNFVAVRTAVDFEEVVGRF